MDSPKRVIDSQPVQHSEVMPAKPLDQAHASMDQKPRAAVLDPPDLNGGPGQRFESPTPFQEAAPMRLQVNTHKALRAATLALGLAVPAVAGPKAYPSEEARLLAKLQIHDRAMEGYREHLARKEAHAGQGASQGASAARATAPEPQESSSQESGRAAAAFAAALSLSYLIATAAENKRQRKDEEASHA